MKPNPKMKKLAAELAVLADSFLTRVADDGTILGTILGWRGFHIQLDSIEDLADRMRLLARGVDRPMREDEASETGSGDT